MSKQNHIQAEIEALHRYISSDSASLAGYQERLDDYETNGFSANEAQVVASYRQAIRTLQNQIANQQRRLAELERPN